MKFAEEYNSWNNSADWKSDKRYCITEMNDKYLNFWTAWIFMEIFIKLYLI